MISPGVVAAIHVAGVRDDPCGAVRWTHVQRTAIPVQAWTDPEGSRSLRFPDFKTVGT